MIQFNLLPDVKLEYIKTERRKHMLISISVLASLVAIGIFASLFVVVNVYQKIVLKSTSSDITSLSKKLTDTDDLNKILTVQNQLSSLDSLHDQKSDAKRVPEYFNQLTPSTVTITNLTVDFEANTMVVIGEAPSFDQVNQFVDTLKYTKFKQSQSTDEAAAFNGVVVASFGRGDKNVNYTINLNFDPALFTMGSKAQLVVPTQTTTRSNTSQPTALFESSTNTTVKTEEKQ